MCRLRKNLTAIVALLAALSLLAGQPSRVWRSAQGELCGSCTFAQAAEAAVTDACCNVPVGVTATDDCRECCTADEGTSSRDGSDKRLFALLAPLTGTTVPRSFVPQTPVAITSLPPVHPFFLHGPPGLRAPPPPSV